jgi:hypothetical protein
VLRSDLKNALIVNLETSPYKEIHAIANEEEG